MIKYLIGNYLYEVKLASEIKVGDFIIGEYGDCPTKSPIEVVKEMSNKIICQYAIDDFLILNKDDRLLVKGYADGVRIGQLFEVTLESALKPFYKNCRHLCEEDPEFFRNRGIGVAEVKEIAKLKGVSMIHFELREPNQIGTYAKHQLYIPIEHKDDYLVKEDR